MRWLVVRRSSSTTTNPRSSTSTPAADSPTSRVRGARPTATRRQENGTCRPFSRWSTPLPPPAGSTRATEEPTWITAPSSTSARSIAAAARGSSRGRIRSAPSTTVTLLPSRAKACPSSQPMLPPPSTTSSPGSRVSPQTLSLVRCSTSASPGTGGTAGAAPVATSACRKPTGRPSISAVAGPVNRAVPVRTETPASSSASTESTGAMCAMAARTWSITAGKSTETSATPMPNR